MLQVNVHHAKTHLSALLALIEEKGECVRICRNGKPIADIRPIQKAKNPLLINKALSGIIFREDPSLPLRPEDWPGDPGE